MNQSWKTWAWDAFAIAWEWEEDDATFLHSGYGEQSLPVMGQAESTNLTEISVHIFLLQFKSMLVHSTST